MFPETIVNSLRVRPPAQRILLLLFFVIPCLTMSQTTPEKRNAPAEKTAGESLKNVRVLKDVPMRQWNDTMTFIAGSLGVSCAYCHGQPWESDAKTTKQAARKMIQMTREINANNFEGRPEVT